MSEIQKDEYKSQPVFQTKASNNTFIVKFKNFTSGVKVLEPKSNRKNYNFPKSENSYESHELTHFWRGVISGVISDNKSVLDSTLNIYNSIFVHQYLSETLLHVTMKRRAEI